MGSSSTENVSYSSIVKQNSEGNSDVFPKKNQAIVIPIVQEITNEEYLVSLSEYIPPSKLRFVSRMSNNRLCVYLDSKETVDKLLENHCEITIRKKPVRIRRLINPVRRILISCVCPIIPHSVIERELTDKVGLKLTSAVSFVNAGFSNSDFQHVYSFRRSVYFTVENEEEIDNVHIPDSIVIKFENEEYRIFLSTEKNAMCFSCKKSGHLVKNCPTPTQVTKKRSYSSTGSESMDVPDPNDTKLQKTSNKSPYEIDILRNPDMNSKKEIKKVNISKKSKSNNSRISDSVKIDIPESSESAYSAEDLQIIKLGFQYLTEKNIVKSPLQDDQFINLILTVRNSSDKIGETKKITNDIPSLVKLIKEIKLQVGKNTKNSLISYEKILKQEIRRREKEDNSN